MPKEKFDAMLNKRHAPGLDAGLEIGSETGTTSRRVRNFSCEICFAVVLTVVAAASVIGVVSHNAAKTASIGAGHNADPTLPAPPKTQ